MLWNLSTKWIGAIKTSIYIYVSPVITVILSVLILHEKITVISIIGTVLILIGLVISQKNQDNRPD
ncbi:EamA family transporter [Anaerostipes sp.]|uniref:EamA family transporter n=2 Tax=Lachnospiraceae TaxID=186803 RepID=UPI00258A72F7|nr:DMT family transporter [Anaerostipes sp.]